MICFTDTEITNVYQPQKQYSYCVLFQHFLITSPKIQVCIIDSEIIATSLDESLTRHFCVGCHFVQKITKNTLLTSETHQNYLLQETLLIAVRLEQEETLINLLHPAQSLYIYIKEKLLLRNKKLLFHPQLNSGMGKLYCPFIPSHCLVYFLYICSIVL